MASVSTERKLDLIIQWKTSSDEEKAEDFDESFCLDLQNKLDKYGHLTPRQESAVDNIFTKFGIDEWAAAEGKLHG